MLKTVLHRTQFGFTLSFYTHFYRPFPEQGRFTFMWIMKRDEIVSFRLSFGWKDVPLFPGTSESKSSIGAMMS